MFPLLQFIDKVGRSCDFAVTELKGLFIAFFAFFTLLRDVPGVERQSQLGSPR